MRGSSFIRPLKDTTLIRHDNVYLCIISSSAALKNIVIARNSGVEIVLNSLDKTKSQIYTPKQDEKHPNVFIWEFLRGFRTMFRLPPTLAQAPEKNP